MEKCSLFNLAFVRVSVFKSQIVDSARNFKTKRYLQLKFKKEFIAKECQWTANTRRGYAPREIISLGRSPN